MTPEEQTALRKQLIVAITDLLRLGNDRYWSRIRQQLEAHGIDPYSSVLADSEVGPGGDYEDGIVVTAGEQVYQFRYEWTQTTTDAGTFTLWADVTDAWEHMTSRQYLFPSQGSPHRISIALALEALASER